MSELWSRFRTVWDNFSYRERMLLSAAGALLAGALLYLVLVNPILGANARAGLRLETAEQQLEAMIRLRREYEDINARLAGVEQRIRENRDRQNTLTLLESLAASSAVTIDSMEERKSPDHELFRETRVEVALKNVTLTQTVSFLHGIESAPRQFSVKGLRVKTRADESELLDVTFTVSSFEAI